jgi:hypothetical protein
VSITGMYDYRKWRILSEQFVEVDSKEPEYKIVPKVGSVKARVFKFDISKIYRHILMKQFTVEISYRISEDVSNQLRFLKYTFDVRDFEVSCDFLTDFFNSSPQVPYFEKETALTFKPLGHYPPDPQILRIFNHKFKLYSGLNRDDENLLRKLE